MENAIKKLDAVLKWLAEHSNSFWTTEMIVSHESYKPLLPEIDIQLLHIILEKLVTEDYASLDESETRVKPTFDEPYKKPAWLYKITFDGLLFYEQHGYDRLEIIKQTELELKQAEINAAVLNRQRQESLTEMLRNYQKWVVIGTLVAAAYYLIEIIKWIAHLFS